MGSTASDIGRGLTGAVTLGGSELLHGNNAFGGGPLGRGLSAGLTGGLTEFTQANPFGVPIRNPLASIFGNGPQSPGAPISGPFSLDPAQLAADTGAITALGKTQGADQEALGQKQYDALTKQIPQTVANQIQQENPLIMEKLNANHVLDSSAYPQEIARQQEYLTQNLQLPALQQLQGTQSQGLATTQGAGQAGLGRQFSLEDFINQANVAKTIGAQAAPQVGNGKGQTGTLLSGIGATAPLLTAAKGLGKGAGAAGAGAAASMGAPALATAGSTLLPAALSLI